MRMTTRDVSISFNASSGEVLEPGELCLGPRVHSTRSMTILACAKAITLDIFVDVALCLVVFLLLLRDLRSQHALR